MAMRRGELADAAEQGSRMGPAPERQYQPVSLERVAPIMKAAVLVSEDHRFYEHAGIDYVEFRHALGYRPDEFDWSNPRHRTELTRALSRVWSRRDRIRGASTITQQLAKNLYLSDSRSPLRKLKEALTAWRLEYWLGKERIMELYLNVVELGPEIWGVEAGSRKYFRKPAARLSVGEAAALAGSLPFPLRSNPGYRPGRMRWRQNMILRRIMGEPVEVPQEVPEVEPVAPPDTTGARREE
jgi:monofunctional biosynthetic peptidoglycan transglycosylase